MSPSFIKTRMNGRVYILMLEFIGGHVKTTSYRSSCDMPADVHTKTASNGGLNLFFIYKAQV